jgi:uncharacterized protein
MRPLVLPSLCVCLLLSARPVGAQEPFEPVKDEAHLFDLKTLQQADERLLELWRKSRLYVVIEAVDTVPREDQGKIRNSRDAKHYFAVWAAQRAKDLRVVGLYVLICRHPGHVEVIAWPKEYEGEYNSGDCERLRRTFVNHKPKGDNNKALLALVDEVRRLVDEKQAPPSPFPWTMVLSIVLGILGIWLLLALVRMRVNAVQAEGIDERHRGLMPGLLGGLFGTVAGHWIYDTIFQRGGAKPPEKTEPALPAAEKPAEPAREESPASPT